MSDSFELRKLQQWMMSVVTHPLGVEEGVESAAAQQQIAVDVEDLESVVCRSEALTAAQRRDVYNNGYYARLLECMQSFFPCLLYALGEEVFNQFTMSYLQAHPPHAYTLNRLADRFVEHLNATRPRDDEAHDLPPDWPEFLIDLARMELAIDQVFDGPGIEGGEVLEPDDLVDTDPNSWASVRLELSPCVRLLKFRFPVNDYYTEFRRENEPSPPDPQETYLALSRIRFVVHRFPIDPLQFQLLAALHSGETLGDAIELIATDDNMETLAQDLQQWFFEWAESGLFLRMT